MNSRGAALVTWGAVAASTAFWGAGLLERDSVPPPVVSPAPHELAAMGDLTRLLGVDVVPSAQAVVPAASDATSRFLLVGVISSAALNSSDQGVALISTGSKPARAYRVGESLESGIVVQSVHRKGAFIGPRGGGPHYALEVQALAQTGNLLVTAASRDAYALAAQGRAALTRSRALVPPRIDGGDINQTAAPNTLLNNPADMAPANALGVEQPPR